MNDVQQRAAAKHFAEYWKGKGYEKGESQKFWLSLLRDVFGVEHPEEYISFEDQVHLDHTSFIDGYIRKTRVLIEQKGLGKDLLKPIKQSDGSLLTPFQQAKRYITELPVDNHPKWVITCNFEKFLVYDMNRPNGEPEVILLENLPTEYYRLAFLVDSADVHLQKEMEISMQAGELVGKLYDAFLKQYKDPTNPRTLKSLNALCVRLVFCLYAEDAGIFGKRLMFHDYMQGKGVKGARKALQELFKVLDQRPEDRDEYLADDDPELAAFPYVNGGLFSDESIDIPPFTDEIYSLLLHDASVAFDWSEISPTIFGAVFESTLNPETRRKGGMHYTSLENIHKVIDPLFLDDLKAEFETIQENPVARTKKQQLEAFQRKLASLVFLDPAAGSGNFLTETYLCLRRLENDVLIELQHGQIIMGAARNPIQVSIEQFYGIEINDFAVTVAKTALWIAESQMLKATEDIVHMQLDFLPLKSYVNIVEGNALRMDWNDVVPKERLSYIMGNPPFVGKSFQTPGQKADMSFVMGGIKGYGNLDYVTCWYIKAIDMMIGNSIDCAFVSTNSICQGIAVPPLWNYVLNQKKVNIRFAFPTFKWQSEASDTATVHCVIIGLTYKTNYQPKLYINGQVYHAKHINAYLLDAPNIIIDDRHNPISNVPKMAVGSFPTDGGNLVIKADEYESFIREEPKSIKYIRPYIGPEEFINRKTRYCLWLKDCPPNELRAMPLVMERVKKVREYRLSSKKEQTRRRADIPTLFAEDRQPDSHYILVPRTSSENRRYLPMGFMDNNTIAGDTIILPDATLYHFGVLTSNVHMAWMRAVCGRLKSDYRYSNTIVYNNFPWPDATPAQKSRIEQTAQAILDARALYPQSSLADLYDELTMPPELRKAHQANDRAVMEAYGMPIKGTTESSCVAELMRRYQAMTAAETKK